MKDDYDIILCARGMIRYWEELVIFGPDTASHPDVTTKAHKVEGNGRTPAPLHRLVWKEHENSKRQAFKNIPPTGAGFFFHQVVAELSKAWLNSTFREYILEN